MTITALDRVDWRNATDIPDADDVELTDTPQDVVAVLGFDPKDEAPPQSAKLQAGAASSKRGCLMAMVDGHLADDLNRWSEENIPDADLDPTEGRETENHVTVYYGFDLDFDTSRLQLEQTKATYYGFIIAKLGKVSRFECPDYDVIIMDVESPAMEAIHADIDDRFDGDGVTPSEHEFHPHLTLAYVKKGACIDLDGSDAFYGRQFAIADLLYSLPNKQGRQTIPLNGVKKP